LAVVGLKKGELFVLRKTVWFALTKAWCFVLRKNGLVRFDKSVLFRFEKNGFFAFRKADLSLWKKRIFRSSNGRLRASRSKGFDSNRRVTNVGSTNLTLSKHGELLYTTIIGRGWEYSVVYFPSWVWIQLQHLNYRCDERSKRRSPLLGGLHAHQTKLRIKTSLPLSMQVGWRIFLRRVFTHSTGAIIIWCISQDSCIA
jgi:hypothetical protein